MAIAKNAHSRRYLFHEYPSRSARIQGPMKRMLVKGTVFIMNRQIPPAAGPNLWRGLWSVPRTGFCLGLARAEVRATSACRTGIPH